jgi:hypothetical protein
MRNGASKAIILPIWEICNLSRVACIAENLNLRRRRVGVFVNPSASLGSPAKLSEPYYPNTLSGLRCPACG